MKEKVTFLFDQFVNEHVKSARCYKEFSKSRQFHSRLISISEFFDLLLIDIEKLTVYNELNLTQLFKNLYRGNYKTVKNKELISDRGWILRQFEFGLFGSDDVFKTVAAEVKDEKPGYPAGLVMDKELGELLMAFSDLGIDFKNGDTWQIGARKYYVIGTLASYDRWLLPLGDHEELLRLSELLPLRMNDFHLVKKSTELNL